MTISDKHSAIEALDRIAALWKEIDTDLSAIWMHLPKEVTQKLKDAPVGENFDALLMHHKYRNIAEAVRLAASAEK